MALDISYHNLACVAGAKRGGGGGRKKGKREKGKGEHLCRLKEPLLLILALVLKQFLYH